MSDAEEESQGQTEFAAGGDRRSARPRRRAVRIFVIVAATYAAVCLLTGLFQTSLIYYPTREYEFVPTDVGLDYEELVLKTSDGESLSAWYVPVADSKGTVIFFHGNAGNMGHRVHTLAHFHRLGVNVIIFDYRGFGESSGRPSENGTYADAEAVWKYVVETRGESPGRVVLFGRSLGGAVAIELAARHRPAGLVVESTFTSLADVAKIHYRWLPIRLLLRHRYASIEKIASIHCPKLFLHGADDQLIPIAIGRTLYGAAKEPKAFVETPGGHNESGFTYSPKYVETMRSFLDSVLSGT